MKTRSLPFGLAVGLIFSGQQAVSRSAQPATNPVPGPQDILAHLRKVHPRLLASTQDFDRIKQRLPGVAPLDRWLPGR